MMASINVLMAVLSLRLALLVTITGAIVLALVTLSTPDPYRLGALAVYAFSVVLPMIWLASRR